MANTKRGQGRPPGSKNKKSSGTSPSAARRVDAIEARNQAKAQIKDEIIGIILVAVGVFLIIALQTRYAGSAGGIISNVLRGTFGFTAFVLPYYFIIYGIMLFMRKTIHMGIKSVILLVIIFLMFALINAGRFMDPLVEGGGFHGLAESYQNGIDLTGGGVFGMYVGSLLAGWIGVPGLYILTFVVIFICLLLLINTPVSRFFEGMKQRRLRRQLERTETAREEAEEVEAAREVRQKQREEDERRRAHAGRHEHIISVMSGEEPPGRSEKPAEEKSFLKKLRGSEPAEKSSEPPAKRTPKPRLSQPETSRQTQRREESAPPAAAEPIIASTYDPDSAAEKLTNSQAAESRLAREDFNAESINENYEFPSAELLSKGKRSAQNRAETENALRQKAMKLEETLRSFGISAQVTNVAQGPAVTRYEVHPDSGVKVKGIKNLADDIALNMEAKSIRIEAPIPGKPAVGIEIENDRINMVTVREIIESNAFRSAKSKISFAVGKDIAGKAIVADLKSMPHLLIAGSTGSGKSVCINTIITSFLYKARPDEVKLVLIDPKVVELSNYNGIPHMLIPVVTEPAKAAAALNWAVAEMDERYRKFAELSCRDLDSYNEKIQKKKYRVIDGEPQRPMPQVVIIIDELADLMMAAPSQVEDSICRLAQKARAAGMHLIVATQRPSVDVITGVIKANIPSRIAFAVSSQVDSRTILDMAGAEKLVGKGDMLFNPLGSGKPTRVQGAFISDNEVNGVIDFVKSQVEETEYSEAVIDKIEQANVPDAEKGHTADMGDELLPDAIELVVGAGQASVSMLQRRFRIGYNRAARIIDMMEERQIIGPSEGSKPRKVLISEEDLQVMQEGAADVSSEN
ncbi:MAG: DNA translocase FtsK [Firmicutes bacterium]|nr:DNA translocase FtsK [Bacillota bacterium]